MNLEICFAVSVMIVLAMIICCIYNGLHKGRTQLIKPLHMVMIGVFLGIFVGALPAVFTMLENESFHPFKTILYAIFKTIQVFILEQGVDLIFENIDQTSSIYGVYSVYMTALYFVAPILTFGFIISFFKDFVSAIHYFFGFSKDAYIFSSLNEKSITLAKDIRKNHPKALLVFTGIRSSEDDSEDELLEEANGIGAILFKKEITSKTLTNHSKKAKMLFFAIDTEEEANVTMALHLLSQYRERENTDLYVFSTGLDGDVILSGAERGKIKLRRINEIQSFVYNYLYKQGTELFDTAVSSGEDNKKIQIVLLGLGQYGTELLKSLCWYCQMDGYDLSIHAFDQNPDADKYFYAGCPEFQDKDPGFELVVHSGVDVNTKDFMDIISAMPQITACFVCLGEDRWNIQQSFRMRMLLERKGDKKALIKTIIYNQEMERITENVINFADQAYNVDVLGDIEALYSEDVLLSNELEEIALEQHIKWYKEEDFWRYSYNYRSSTANAIHRNAKIYCEIPGADQPENELPNDIQENIQRLEHRRWNAYMKAEGYIYSGSKDKSSRNDMAKMHHDITAFEDLSEEDKRKDSVMSAK